MSASLTDFPLGTFWTSLDGKVVGTLLEVTRGRRRGCSAGRLLHLQTESGIVRIDEIEAERLDARLARLEAAAVEAQPAWVPEVGDVVGLVAAETEADAQPFVIVEMRPLWSDNPDILIGPSAPPFVRPQRIVGRGDIRLLERHPRPPLPDAYWLVHGTGPTNHRHASHEAAAAEAHRLADMNPGVRFTVLGSGVSFIRPIGPVRRDPASNAPTIEPDDDIPF